MARPRRDPNVKQVAVVRLRRVAVVRLRRAALLVSTALCATVIVVVPVPAAAQPAPNAHPTGGVVVGGGAAISQGANQTTINQATARAAINWRTFDVGSRQSVQFNQPSAASVTLNKVLGPNPSQIAGRIDANGQIVVENQAGVIFYKGSQVNAAGLMVSAATSSDPATRAFLNGGNLVMDQAANADAAVVNQGQITVKQAGLAALVAPRVANSGLITARLGHVVLAGGSKATLDLYGDGMLSIDVTGQVVKLPDGATALVTNSGVIAADGGTVQLTARAADGLMTTLVDAGGTIRAATVGHHTGTITLNGIGGSVIVEGQLNATGNAASTVGGSIEVNPTGNVTVASGARIDASGQAGGGLVAIGTTLMRAAGGASAIAAPTAASVTVRQGATIAANATRKGNGGRVTVLSTTSTDMAGNIEARGGPHGGDGGFVEISGNQAYSLTGSVNASAPLGLTGTILIDPFDLTVILPNNLAATESGNFATNLGTVLAGDGLTGTPDTIFNSEVNNISGNVELQAIHNLQVSAPISLIGTNASLTLRAGNNLTVDAGIGIATNGGSVLFTAADSSIAGFTPAGSITFNGSLNTGGIAGVTMSAGTGGIALNGNITAGVLDLSATGGGVLQTGGTIAVTTLQSSGNVTGDVSLTGVGSPLLTVANFAVGGGGFRLINTGSIVVSGGLTATGDVTLQTPAFGGVTTTGTGAIASQTSGLLQIIADAVSFTGSGKVSATTVELAPNTPGTTMTLGGSGGLSLSQATLAHISAQTLRLGAAGTAPKLITSAGSINITGSIDLTGIATTLDLHGTGAVTESGVGSLNNIGTLTGATGPVSLAVGLDRGIGDIGGYTVSTISTPAPVPGDFIVQNLSSTGISGPLNARNVSITETGATVMNVTGTIAATGTTSLNAGSITFGTASNVQGTTITLNAVSGVNLVGGAALGLSRQTSILDVSTAAGGFTEATTAAIAAGTLQSSGGVVGGVNLPGNNAVDTIGSFTVTPPTVSSTADFVLNDLSALNVNGPLTVTSGNIYLVSSNPSGIGAFGAISASGRVGLQADALAIDGAVTAGTFELAPFTSGGTLTLGAFGSGLSLAGAAGFIQAGLLRLGAVTLPGGTAPTTTAGTIVVGGTFDAGGSNLELDALGPVNGAAGPLINVGTLSGTAGAWTLINTGNSISALGDINASSFVMDDAIGLGVNGTLAGGSTAIVVDTGTISVAGTVNATAVVLAATDLYIPGLVNATTGTLVATTGSIVETGGLIVGTLTGVAALTADLSGSGPSANQVATLSNFSAESFTLRDGSNLLIANSLIAPDIALLAPTSQVTLGNGAVILTGGNARPAGGITASLEPANGAPGAFIQAAGFTQTGISTITGAGNGPATLQISVTGNARFDPPLGLLANTTWLILNLTNGSAAGNVFVNALDVSYTQPGSAALLGSIAGNTTGGAAALGSILPAVSSAYTFNGCIIGATVCQPFVPPNQPATPPAQTQSTSLYRSTLLTYTSVLGSLYRFLPGTPEPLLPLPEVDLVAIPVLPAPAGQLTDPDVVPPNISFQDY